MTRICISYRRDDSKWQARPIYNAFCQVVANDDVFMDIDSIPPGANFRKTLKSWVNECDVLLALIGPDWIDATDPSTGQRRLDNPSDFVRIEIGEALTREIPVVPVVLDGTPLPDVDLLPDDLKELADRQAEFVNYLTFDTDVARLIRKLRLGAGAPTPTAPVSGPRPTVTPQSSEESFQAEGRIRVHTEIVHGAPGGWFLPGAGKTEWFMDHEHGPEMVIVPAGNFLMGSLYKEEGRDDNEGPQHRVAIQEPLAVSRFAITFAEWDAAQDQPDWQKHSCTPPRKPDDWGWGRDRRPVIDVSW